jgi:hypothetical protein
MNIRTGSKAVGSLAAVLLMLLGIFAIPFSVSALPVTINDQLTTATGTTTDFGGGDYFYVKFGTDASFGVVWGTEETANNIYFVATKARYLGVAQVYDDEGNVVLENRTIKIYTVYAVKLEDMLEFGDLNGNGVLPYKRVYDTEFNFTGDYVSSEPIYKKADLKTAWTQSQVTYVETDDEKLWSFDLTASDLPYVPMDSYTGETGDNVLNNLTLSFHLSANMIQMDNASLPQWRITVQKSLGNMWWFYDAEKMDDIQVSGKVISYNVKWDQRIEGWDYDEANTVNASLLMEFSALAGNYIPAGVWTWMNMNMVRAMNEYGYAYCREVSGDLNLSAEPVVFATPKQLASPLLRFGGERTRIGALEWVSNVTVDGEQGQVHAQVMAGVPVYAVAMNGARFGGFAVLGAMTFPGGQLIDHDPTFSSDALVDVSTDGATQLPVGILLVGAAAAVIVIIAILALVTMEKKPGQKMQQNYERTKGSQPGEWTKYFDKNRWS